MESDALALFFSLASLLTVPFVPSKLASSPSLAPVCSASAPSTRSHSTARIVSESTNESTTRLWPLAVDHRREDSGRVTAAQDAESRDGRDSLGPTVWATAVCATAYSYTRYTDVFLSSKK